MCGHSSETVNTLTQIVELKHGQLSNEEAIKAPVTLYRIASERRDFYTGSGFCLH